MDLTDMGIPTGLSGLLSELTNWGVRIAGVLLALFLAWILGGALRRAINGTCARRGLDLTLSRFFANTARYTLLAAAGIGCLGVFGIETSSFAALIAAMGLAIGLAFQGTLSNFAAGAMLLIFRPFKVDDVIRAGGELGKVKEIELFTTELVTADNRRIIVPNSKIFGDTIENITYYPTRRVEVAVGAAYEADIRQTREVLLKAAKGLGGVLEDPAPEAFLSDLGDSSVNWKVRVWCNADDYWATVAGLTEAVKYAMDSAKIGIPFPQMDVHVQK